MSPLYARQHPPFCHLCHDRGLPLHNHSRCHQGLLLLPLCHLQHYSRCHQGLPVLPLCHPHHYSRYYKGLPNFNPHHHHKACISLSCMCQTNQCTLLLIKAPQMIQIVQNHGPQMYFITFHLCHYPPHNCDVGHGPLASAMRMLWMANYIVRQSRGDRGLILPQGPQTAPQARLVQPHVPPLRPTAPTILSPLSQPRLTPPQPLMMPPRPTPPTPLPPATLTVPPRPTRPTTLPPTPLLTVLQRPTELQPTPSPPRMHLPVLHVPDQSMHPLTHQSTPNDPDSPEPRSPTVFYNIPPMPLPPSQLPPPAAPTPGPSNAAPVCRNSHTATPNVSPIHEPESHNSPEAPILFPDDWYPPSIDPADLDESWDYIFETTESPSSDEDYVGGPSKRPRPSTQ